MMITCAFTMCSYRVNEFLIIVAIRIFIVCCLLISIRIGLITVLVGYYHCMTTMLSGMFTKGGCAINAE